MTKQVLVESMGELDRDGRMRGSKVRLGFSKHVLLISPEQHVAMLDSLAIDHTNNRQTP